MHVYNTCGIRLLLMSVLHGQMLMLYNILVYPWLIAYGICQSYIGLGQLNDRITQIRSLATTYDRQIPIPYFDDRFSRMHNNLAAIKTGRTTINDHQRPPTIVHDLLCDLRKHNSDPRSQTIVSSRIP